jgi:hypothetical protein
VEKRELSEIYFTGEHRMKNKIALRFVTHARLAALGFFLLLAPCAKADSYTGTLMSPEDTYSLVFNVTGTTNETVTAQTWSFGGGTNAAGTVIAPGGFDPLLGFFSGTGDSATAVTDAFGNPYIASDDLLNFSSFAGCPER